MTKKFLCILSISLVFMFSFAKADVMEELPVVKVNGIEIYEHFSNKLISIAKAKNIEFIIDDIEKTVEIDRSSELSKEILSLYEQAMSLDSTNVIVSTRNKCEDSRVILGYMSVDRDEDLIIGIRLCKYYKELLATKHEERSEASCLR